MTSDREQDQANSRHSSTRRIPDPDESTQVVDRDQAGLGISSREAVPLGAQTVIYLQRALGNRATTKIIAGAIPKLDRQRPGRRAAPAQRKPVSLKPVHIQREAAHWYTPWLQDLEHAPGGRWNRRNVDRESRSPLDSGWRRNALSNALISILSGVATHVIAKRLKVEDLYSLIFGSAVGGYQAYRGFTVQERVWGESVESYKWYGKYRFNYLTGDISAVRFDGTGPRGPHLVAPWHYQQRIVDAAGEVIYAHDRQDIMAPGLDLSRQTNLPESSFGEFD